MAIVNNSSMASECPRNDAKDKGSDHQESDILSDSCTTSNWMTVNSAKLHYVCHGSGPHPLLLIPGALGVAQQQYRPQLDYFGKEGSGFKVVSFDPRGYGESHSVERPKSNSFTTDALDGYELMLSLSLPEFSVLAFCDGGRTGLTLASLFPQSVRKLVVFSTSSYITEDEMKIYEKTRDVRSWNAKIFDSLTKLYGSSFQDKWSAYLDELKNCLAVNNGDICTKALSKISCPTLIVHGAKDEFIPLFQAEYLLDHVTRSRLVVMEHGKHFLHLKHHQEFNAMVKDFLIPEQS